LFTLQTVPPRLQGPELDPNGAARAGGFSLHAGVAIAPGKRARLERLCRYVSRPLVASERLALTPSGQVRCTLKTPYRDGTTHLVLKPLDLMARRGMGAAKPPVSHQPPTPRHVAMNRAKRLKRVFGIEIDTCQRCGGMLRIIASIEQPAVIAEILAHLERTAPQPTQPGLPLGARAPPGLRIEAPSTAGSGSPYSRFREVDCAAGVV
jgi:hypothetical protein